MTNEGLRSVCAILSSSKNAKVQVFKVGPPRDAPQVSEEAMLAVKRLIAERGSLEVLEIKGLCDSHRATLAAVSERITPAFTGWERPMLVQGVPPNRAKSKK